VSPEGIANYVYNISLKLLERGHEVTVITRGFGRKIEEDHLHISNAVVRVFRVPTIPLYPFHVHAQGLLARRLFKMLEPDLEILHVHSPYVPAVKTSLPIITTIHTLERVDISHYEEITPRSLAFRMSANIFASMESDLFGKSRMLTAVSNHVFNELKKFYGLRREGVVLGNGVDETQFLPLVSKAAGTGEYVLFVGRMDYRKGLFDLTRCAKYVCDERPDVSFVLVGNGPLASSTNRESRRMGLEKNVVFAGYVSRRHLIQLYQNASVCVIPSHYEGLPTVMLEAMACGVPVVATNIGGHVDVISHGTNGYLVPAGSPKSMANTISMLLKSQELRAKIGRAARCTIEEKYTWDRISERMMHCYDRVLEERDAVI
jgi:glycosyltransferase involved in cell wall biosynthesis